MAEIREPVVPCPKCGRQLLPSGVIDVNGDTLFAFQCDECIVPVELFGKTHEGSLTFAADDTGKVVPHDSLPD